MASGCAFDSMGISFALLEFVTRIRIFRAETISVPLFFYQVTYSDISTAAGPERSAAAIADRLTSISADILAAGTAAGLKR
jgi:hypothetical protein